MRLGVATSERATTTPALAVAACQRHPGRRAIGQLPEHDPQRVAAIDPVVAIGRQHERGDRLDAASEQAQDVERRLIGPVEVLEHDDVRRPAAQLARQRGDELARRGALRDQRSELAADVVGDVDERAERARGEQRVARSPQHPTSASAVAERPHERRLADSRLAGDEDEPPAALRTHRRQVAVECLELRAALEQPCGCGTRRPIAHGHHLGLWRCSRRDQPRRQSASPTPMASQPATTYGKAS
jgi:hypothetical protein